MNTLAQSLDLAVKCHQAGDLQQAEQLYRQILQVDPNHADAIRLLGLIALQLGQTDSAVDYIRQALRLKPDFAEAHNLLAIALRQQGKLDEAVSSWRQALSFKPDYAEAYNLLAIACKEKGLLEEAAANWRQVIRLRPNDAEAHGSLANVLMEQGKLDDAVAAYKQVLRLEPESFRSINNLGCALVHLGKAEEAVRWLEEALRIKPDYVQAQNNLGNALMLQGKQEDAVASYRRALHFDPNFADAYCNLGKIFLEQHRLDEAVANFRKALHLRPNFVEALNNLANAFLEQGQIEQAIANYQDVLRFQPKSAGAYSNLGKTFLDQGRLDEAVDSLQQALQIEPDFAEAHNNLGLVRRKQGKLDEAVACYRRAFRSKPNYAEAHFNEGQVLWTLGDFATATASFQRALQQKPDYVAALVALVHAFQHLCRWENLTKLSRRIIELNDGPADAAVAAAMVPFSFVTLPIATTAAQQLRCARDWVAQQPQLTLDRADYVSRNRSTDLKSKITIGYASADFWAHPTAYLTAELFEQHDRDQFTIVAYSYSPDDGSPMRRRLVNAFDRFVDLNNDSDLDAARRIAADGVDILVDLKGHTRDGRLQIFAARPAPIQVNYLAYPGTMGAPYIDYILVDDFLVPPDQQPFFMEQLVHLPLCYQVNDSRREIASRTPSRAECGLPEEGFVFCCFNNSYKITPELFDVWMNLLKALPGSVIWLLIGNDFAPANLRREAVARGIAEDRLVFAPRQPLAEHLARHRVADLFLDCFPVNAHTTASDALWAGCPVLTLAGETLISRVAGSLLRAVGLPELITTSLEEYQAVALRLARDPNLLAHVRSKLAESRKTSPLFDARQFARNLERAYITMREINASGQQPRPFAVSST
jgi:predicted O-linked N-acetylglucosamine transferase (SPINDLY family)